MPAHAPNSAASAPGTTRASAACPLVWRSSNALRQLMSAVVPAALLGPIRQQASRSKQQQAAPRHPSCRRRAAAVAAEPSASRRNARPNQPFPLYSPPAPTYVHCISLISSSRFLCLTLLPSPLAYTFQTHTLDLLGSLLPSDPPADGTTTRPTPCARLLAPLFPLFLFLGTRLLLLGGAARVRARARASSLPAAIGCAPRDVTAPFFPAPALPPKRLCFFLQVTASDQTDICIPTTPSG